MSYRPPRPPRAAGRRRQTVVRGASRPIDPRRAPGGPPRRRFDPFGIILLTVSGIVLFVLVLLIAMQSRNSGQTVTNLTFPTLTPDWTKTAVAFSTQTAPDVIPRITVADAKKLYDVGDVKMIDVRDEQFYKAGHIKGAINIPQAQLQTRMKDIPRTGNVVLYCQ